MVIRTEPVKNYIYGDLLTMEEWIASVECGALIDYDGFGHYVLGDTVLSSMSMYVKPSMLKRNEVFTQTYTHIMWYNR
jgi:hypothetical protein